MNKLKVAACQLQIEVGNVRDNLLHAQEMIEEAFRMGAEWVILPEFFPSGMAFDPVMRGVALPLKDETGQPGPVVKLLTDAARKHNGYVGGSAISITDPTEPAKRYNTFILAQPDGTYGTHSKDIPTFYENCYYIGGSDDGIIRTENYTVGAVLCAEFWRWRTVRRLIGKVDFVVGGSGWWNLPVNWPIFKNYLHRMRYYGDTRLTQFPPLQVAKALGVPVINACLTGPLNGGTPLLPCLPWESYFMGQTQIVKADGTVLARLSPEDGQGIITAEIEPGKYLPSVPTPPFTFWSVNLTVGGNLAWRLFNAYGRRYYKKMVKKGVYA